MKNIVMRVAVTILIFSISASLVICWLNSDLKKQIKYSNKIPMKYKKMLLEHPLSFQLTKAICGGKISINVFYSSDGETTKRIMKTSESFVLAKEELQDFLKGDYEVIEEKKVSDFNKNQIGLENIVAFKDENKQVTQMAIVKIYYGNTTIISGPTLWHTKELEHYLIYKDL